MRVNVIYIEIIFTRNNAKRIGEIKMINNNNDNNGNGDDNNNNDNNNDSHEKNTNSCN